MFSVDFSGEEEDAGIPLLDKDELVSNMIR